MNVEINEQPKLTKIKRNIDSYQPILGNMGIPESDLRKRRTKIYTASPQLVGARGVTTYGNDNQVDIILADDSERVTTHELDHKTLIEYLGDIVDKNDKQESNYFGLLNEMFAEYGRFKHHVLEGEDRKAKEMLSDTPYPWAFEMGQRIDELYESNIGNGRGFEAMLKDTYDKKDITYGLERYGQLEEREIAELHPPEELEKAA